MLNFWRKILAKPVKSEEATQASQDAIKDENGVPIADSDKEDSGESSIFGIEHARDMKGDMHTTADKIPEPDSPGSGEVSKPRSEPQWAGGGDSKKSFAAFIKKYRIPVLCCALSAALVVTSVFAIPAIADSVWESRGNTLSEAMALTADGFENDQTVYLNGAKWLTVQDVREGVIITPKVDFTVFAVNDTGSFGIKLLNPGRDTYTLVFTEPFKGNRKLIKFNEHPFDVELSMLNARNQGVGDPIYLTFTEPISQDDLSNYISIYPEVYFEMYCEGEVATIFTYEPLAYNTDYTITVSKGLESYDRSKKLEADKQLSFHTQMHGFSVTMTNPGVGMLTEKDSLTLKFDAYLLDTPNAKSLPMTIEVYRFTDLETYLAQGVSLTTSALDLSHLEKAAEYTHELVNEVSGFTLPNPGLGGYIVNASVKDPETGEEYLLRKSFSVTDLSLYAQTCGVETLLWANGGVSGEPLAGYKAEFTKPGGGVIASAETDRDGVAVVSHYEENQGDYYSERGSNIRIISLRNEAGKLLYVDNTSVLNLYNSPDKANRYYAFMQLDRTLFRPTDEINLWGYVRAYKNNRDPLPKNVEVAFGEDSLNELHEFVLHEDGTFQGTIQLEAVKSTNYSLELRLPTSDKPTAENPNPTGTYLAYQYIQVKEFQKPAYTIEVENDKDFYLPGDDVTVTVTPTFYDGTPMPFYDLEFMTGKDLYGDYNPATTITTNAEGVAVITFPAAQYGSERTGWLPSSNRYLARISDDGENISQTGSYRYLPSDTIAAASVTEMDEGKLKLNVETAALDFSKIKTIEDLDEINPYDYSWNYFGYNDEQYKALKGEPRDLDVKITANFSYYSVSWGWVDGYANSSGYYGQKWDWKTGTKEYSIKTAEGLGEILDLIDVPYDPNRYFSLDVTMEYEDSGGREAASSYYWYNGRYHPSDDETRRTFSPGYNFYLTDQNGKEALGEYISYLPYNEASFLDGDTMNFHLWYQDKPAENKGRILYTVIRGGIVEKGITAENTIQLKQSIENANSFNLVAAYFDGTTVYPIRNTVVALDKTSIALNVDIKPDRQSYGPGENVNLSVRVTDKNGRGVSGVTCVSIVDESIFALQEQYIDVLYDLYSDMYFSHYYIQKYATAVGDFVHEYGINPPTADGGKGDGANLQFLDKLRKNFKDTALFRLVRTDANGNAKTGFTLPDNVTSWRITGVSIGDNLYAGQSKANFVSTMPFFVQPVISSKYIAGDDIAMLVQGHGVVLNEKSEIAYTVNLKGDGIDETLEAKNTAYKSCEVNFGKLPEGEYTVTVTAQTGNYRDSVELPLAVIGSNLELVVSKIVSLDKKLDINAVRYPVSLTFYDRAHEAYFSSISSLLTHYCMWASQRMSRFTAKRALMQHMDPGNIPQHISAGNDTAADMQNYDGGIGAAPGETSDPEITAKVLIIAKDQFNLYTMSDYFKNILSLTTVPEEKAACYLGLSAIGEEITGLKLEDELAAMIKDASTTPYMRAYCIASLAYLGKEEAPSLYEEYVTPNMQSEGDGRYFNSATANQGDTTADDNITAAVWIAASRLGHKDADGISIYFAKNSWRISTLFECMIYVTHYDKEVIPSRVTYKVKGKDVTVDLGVRGQKTVAFNKSEFDSLEIVDAPNQLAARAYYIGEPAEVDIMPTDKFTIKKEIFPLANDRSKIMLTLDLSAEAPYGVYDISDWVPSNMRLYSVDKTNRGIGDYWWYTYSTEGQKLYFRIHHSGGKRQIKLYYTAQRTYGAEAVVDTAYVIHGDSGENNLTTKSIMK